MKIEEIRRGNIAVHCNTQEKANRIVRELEELIQKKAVGPNVWFLNKEDTCYEIETYGKTRMVADTVKRYKEKGYEIVEFEDIEEFKKELKEEVKLTTQEVLERNAVKIQEALALRIQEQCTGLNEDNAGIAELTEAWIKIRNII